MKDTEFRLVLYMNGTDAINFTGGRAAASPLAYYFHINQNPKKKRKVLLGGHFIFKGLGKDGPDIKDELEEASKPISLVRPWNSKRKKGICISNKAYIYQNNDPLFTQAENAVYWKATINKIGRLNWFTAKEQKEYTLRAVQMGLDTYTNRENNDDKKHHEWVALVSKLERFVIPVEKIHCPWKVYGGNEKWKNFWDVNNKMPSIPYINAFVHATPDEWRKFDKSAKSDTPNIKQVTDTIIKHNRIHESLVHEILKMLFAREGWWVNFEVPVPIKRGKRGRIDFLVKQSARHHWKVIEVKLRDNPDAVEQLHYYLEGIEEDVKNEVKKEDGSYVCDSYFWPLWNGGGRKRIRYTEPKGVVLCAKPGTDTIEEAKKHGYDVWTYEYSSNDNNELGIKIWDATNNISIAET